jgi:hypothetical protein
MYSTVLRYHGSFRVDFELLHLNQHRGHERPEQKALDGVCDRGITVAEEAIWGVYCSVL